MGLTREDYAELGRKDAQAASGGKAPAHMPQGSKSSWQTKAYDEAFAAEMARLEDSLADLQSQTGETFVKMRGGGTIQFTGRHVKFDQDWPQAAAEHARCLAARIHKGDPHRERLLRSLLRLQKRHGFQSAYTFN